MSEQQAGANWNPIWPQRSCGAYLDALAAAYAEAGQYAEAAKWQQEALADSEFVKGYGEEAQARLALYKAYSRALAELPYWRPLPPINWPL